MKQLSDEMHTKWRTCRAWLLQERHKQQARELGDGLNRVFTEHPHEAGETYWEHLRFTFSMSARFMLVTLVLLIHGLFPFLLVKAASRQIEIVYGIMKTRIPKARRDEIDDLDYCV